MKRNYACLLRLKFKQIFTPKPYQGYRVRNSLQEYNEQK